jgi:hypothetical protein
MSDDESLVERVNAMPNGGMFGISTSSQAGRAATSVEFAIQGRTEPVGIEVSAGWSTITEGVKQIMIDTMKTTGRIRIYLNEAIIYEGDPEVDEL